MTQVRSLARHLSSAVPVLILLALWQTATAAGWVDKTVLPGLHEISHAFVDLLTTGELGQNLGVTLATSFGGLAIGLLVGVALGLSMALYRPVEGFFGPLIKTTYALPKTALIPLLVLWFGVGGITNVSVVAVTTLLPIVVYTFNAAHSVPAVMQWSALSLGTRPVTMLWHVLLPSALPAIFTATRIALGFAFVVAIACEMVVSNFGIGKLMFLYGDNGSYDYMFAALMVVIATAYLADTLLAVLSRSVLSWSEGARKRV